MLHLANCYINFVITHHVYTSQSLKGFVKYLKYSKAFNLKSIMICSFLTDDGGSGGGDDDDDDNGDGENDVGELIKIYVLHVGLLRIV